MEQDLFALKLQGRDVDGTLQLSINMEQGLTTTGHVPAPNPTVAALAAKRALFGPKKVEIAAAASALAMKEEELNTLRLELGGLLVLSARDSQTVVAGDRTKMGEMMIPLRALGTPVSDNPPPLAGLHADDGDMASETDWSWPARRPGRPLYHLETAPSAAGPYTHAYTGLKSKCTTHTASGVEIWGRVIVELNGFKSDPSSPVAFRPH